MSSPCSELRGCLCLPCQVPSGKCRSRDQAQQIHTPSAAKCREAFASHVQCEADRRATWALPSVSSVLGGQVLSELRVRAGKQSVENSVQTREGRGLLSGPLLHCWLGLQLCPLQRQHWPAWESGHLLCLPVVRNSSSLRVPVSPSAKWG